MTFPGFKSEKVGDWGFEGPLFFLFSGSRVEERERERERERDRESYKAATEKRKDMEKEEKNGVLYASTLGERERGIKVLNIRTSTIKKLGRQSHSQSTSSSEKHARAKCQPITTYRDSTEDRHQP